MPGIFDQYPSAIQSTTPIGQQPSTIPLTAGGALTQQGVTGAMAPGGAIAQQLAAAQAAQGQAPGPPQQAPFQLSAAQLDPGMARLFAMLQSGGYGQGQGQGRFGRSFGQGFGQGYQPATQQGLGSLVSGVYPGPNRLFG